MKRVLLVCLFLLLVPLMASAQDVLQSATTATATGGTLAISASASTNGVMAQITGTFSATVTWRATFNGTDYVDVTGTNLTDGSQAATATASGMFCFVLPHIVGFRAVVTSYSSGSITVVAAAANGVARNYPSGGGGGGSGTVTHLYGTNANGFTFSIANPTTTPNITLTMQDGVADGATKGIAGFLAADFNAASGIISIDYTNAQKATSSVPGLLTAADWSTFNGKQGGDATLAALAAFNTNGVLVQTTADTFTGRTIIGTADKITVTNGDGVSGNPTLTIASTYIGQSSITTLGTVTTGIWNGTTIVISNGGTGQTTKAAAFDALSPMTASGDLIYGGASGTGTRLVKDSDGKVLTLVSGLPAWAAPSGGGGTPAGSSGDYQINNSGAFGAGLINQTSGNVLINIADTTSGTIQFGGTGNTRPGIRTNGVIVEFVLANQSNFAGIKVDRIAIGNVTNPTNSGLVAFNAFSLGEISSEAAFLSNPSQGAYMPLRVSALRLFGASNLTVDTAIERNAAGRVAFTQGSGTTGNGDITFTNAVQLGKTTTYNNVVTAGNGLAAIVASGRVTAQSAANASIASYTVGASDSSFDISMNMNVTAATILSTSMNCDYTDESNTARTMILPTTSIGGTFLSGGMVTATGSFETAVFHIRCKAGTAVTLYTAAGTFTGVTYTAEGNIKQTK